MAGLGKNDLLKPRPPKRKQFPLGTFDGFAPDDFVTLQALSGADLVELQKKSGGKKANLSNTEQAAHILRLSLVDDGGAKLFPAEADAQALLSWPAGLIEAMAKEAVELSGLRAESDEGN